jgi:hypothetical protein
MTAAVGYISNLSPSITLLPFIIPEDKAGKFFFPFLMIFNQPQ